MVAHLCLRYRTDSEGLQQQEIIDSLPKAIRSSISHYLFYEVVDNIYLFHGISNDLLFQLVSVSYLAGTELFFFLAKELSYLLIVTHRLKRLSVIL